MVTRRLLVWAAAFWPGVAIVGIVLLLFSAAEPNVVKPYWLALGEARDWILGLSGNSFGAICDTFLTCEACC